MGIYLLNATQDLPMKKRLASGPTTFYTESQTHYETPNPKKVLWRLFAEQGDILLFNQRITHDGSPYMLDANKYILRTDVYYKLAKPAGDEPSQKSRKGKMLDELTHQAQVTQMDKSLY